MNNFYAYSFLFGMFVGGYTNFFSKIVISGLVSYMVHPDYFSLERFNPLYNTIYQSTYPYVSKIYDFHNVNKVIENNSDKRVQLIESPVNKIPISPLPKLVIKK